MYVSRLGAASGNLESFGRGRGPQEEPPGPQEEPPGPQEDGFFGDVAWDPEKPEKGSYFSAVYHLCLFGFVHDDKAANCWASSS